LILSTSWIKVLLSPQAMLNTSPQISVVVHANRFAETVLDT
jgi:hypothetical protein